MSKCYFIRVLEKSTALFWADYREPHNHSDNKCEKYRRKMIIETWLSLLWFSLNSRILSWTSCLPNYFQIELKMQTISQKLICAFVKYNLQCRNCHQALKHSTPLLKSSKSNFSHIGAEIWRSWVQIRLRP
jgi:hypothetical protein